MLADPNLKKVEITVLGAGSSLIGGTLKTEILREEALELTLEGFLPFCELTTSRRKRSAACSASWACLMFPTRPSRATWRRF